MAIVGVMVVFDEPQRVTWLEPIAYATTLDGKAYYRA